MSNSTAAIDPATVAFPVTMKLMMKVSMVPVTLQLMAFASERPRFRGPEKIPTHASYELQPDRTALSALGL